MFDGKRSPSGKLNVYFHVSFTRYARGSFRIEREADSCPTIRHGLLARDSGPSPRFVSRRTRKSISEPRRAKHQRPIDRYDFESRVFRPRSSSRCVYQEPVLFARFRFSCNGRTANRSIPIVRLAFRRKSTRIADDRTSVFFLISD